MDKKQIVKLLLTVDEDEVRASALVPRRYEEMVGAYERLRERHRR